MVNALKMRDNDHMETEKKFESAEWSEEGKEFEKKFLAIFHKDRIEISKKVAGFVRGMLWNKYNREDLDNYEAYHIVIRSTLIKKPEYFDLEGDDSIVHFIDTLAEEMENKNKE